MGPSRGRTDLIVAPSCERHKKHGCVAAFAFISAHAFVPRWHPSGALIYIT